MNAPQAPDPYATAAAQTASNKDTANYQQSLNQTNQITPYGSINYQQTGTAPNGAPLTTATTSLSQPVQNLVDSNLSNAQGMSDLGGRLQGAAGDAIGGGTPGAPQFQNLTGLQGLGGLQNLDGLQGLGGLQNLSGTQNLDLGPSALQAKIDAANRATLDPQWATLGKQNEQTLYDRGLAPGSEGYTQGMNDFNNARNSAYNSMYVADQGQAAADLTAQNNSYNTNLAAQNQSANANLSAQQQAYNTNLAAQNASYNTNYGAQQQANNQNAILQNASANQNAQSGFGNQLTAYNAPLNALSALQSGSQISQPGVGQTATGPQTSVAGTNIAGLIQSNYQNQLAQHNATMGGLFGLGGSALQAGAMFL